jgi:tetratricopeptide (TPR) repeat protein
MSKKSKRERRERLFKKKVVAIGLVAIIVLSLGAGALFYFLRPDPEGQISEQDKELIDASTLRTQEDGKLREKAKEELKSSSPEKAGVVYQQAADNTADVNRKVELYVELANVYYDAGKSSDAIDSAKKALDLTNDKFLAADWLSRAYEDQKNYPEAIKYYQLAGEWVLSPQNELRFDKGYYDKQITRVQALQGAR